MSNVTGNQFTMAHFHDFYFVEAMQAGVSMAKASNPELAFSHSVERLENDVNEMMSYLSHNIALRVYVYLYAASLGEARHASDLCKSYITQLRNAPRDTTYNKALDFFPNDNNVTILRQMFTQQWSSGGFGGTAWLSIVDGMLLYGKVTDATFIDHAVDLEHNSGSVFTKPTQNINFQCFGSYDANSLRSFLDWKFRADILNDENNTKYWNGTYRMSPSVSGKVYRLLVRYSNIIKTIKAVDYCKPELEFLSPYEIEWGFNDFTVNGNYVEAGQYNEQDDWNECDNCSNKIDPDNHYHDKYNHCICRSCYYRLTKCEHCNEMVRITHTVDGRKEWCSDCVTSYAHNCDHCGEWVTGFIAQCQDNGYILCENCLHIADYCETCGEHYYNIDQHNDEEHKEPEEIQVPLWVDGDGIFEVVEPVEKTVYHIASFKFFTTHGTYNLSELVYDIPGSGFVVTNIDVPEGRNGKVSHCNTWSLTNVTSGYNMGKYSTKEKALKIAYAIKDIIDWNTITGQSDYDALPEDKKDDIKHAKSLATW